MQPISTCRICQTQDRHPCFIPREMMHGTRETFDYFACLACGTVQIASIPADLSPYYRDYYSFEESGRLERLIKTHLAYYSYQRFDPLGWLLSWIFGPNGSVSAICRAGISTQASVLDVGCGAGEFLEFLSMLGFTAIAGIDPFLPQEKIDRGSYSLRRADITGVQDTYDVITLNHVFEHLADPLATLQALGARLSADGLVILRVPVADSYAFQHYNTDWVQWDAPRHLYLHTRAGIHHLAQHSGLMVSKEICDSIAFQFWGSEQYRQDIPLRAPGSLLSDRRRFLRQIPRLLGYTARANRLNRKGMGDSVTFFLRKATV